MTLHSLQDLFRWRIVAFLLLQGQLVSRTQAEGMSASQGTRGQFTVEYIPSLSPSLQTKQETTFPQCPCPCSLFDFAFLFTNHKGALHGRHDETFTGLNKRKENHYGYLLEHRKCREKTSRMDKHLGKIL